MTLILIGICLLGVVGAYFWNNPMGHTRSFMIARFMNWFPLGMTYAFLYMGRYNLNVAKNALGGLMTKQDFGLIFAAGTWTYALSFLVNGPLVDRIGGKKGILIAAIGSSLANVAMGVLTYLLITGRLHINMVLTFSVIYSLNMYFQSYGAVSIIKVKAYWFHVRERGVFGAIFGTLISVGTYFAFDWNQSIAEASAIKSTSTSYLHSFIHSAFTSAATTTDAVWSVFFIPALILVVWIFIDLWLVKDSPEDAGHASFDTHDASSGSMHVVYTAKELLAKVFKSRLMLLIAAINLTSGFFRNGVQQWYPIFAHEVKQPGAETFQAHYGFYLCIFGIVGSFAGGYISDKLFHSRRGPPAVMFSALVAICSLVMAAFLFTAPVLVAILGLIMVMCSIGVTSLMAGTAATDFGGRKATATSSGIVDGFAYLGSGIQSVSLGYITTHNWQWWPLFIAPWAILGAIIAYRIWNELPAATRKYINEVESKKHKVA